MGKSYKDTHNTGTKNKESKMTTRPAKRVRSMPAVKKVSRAEKVKQIYELKMKVHQALNSAGLDTTLKYLPYAKLFEFLFMALEPDIMERRARLRRIISGVPKLDDAYWIEVLCRYCADVKNLSDHYCSFDYKPKF